MYARVELSYKYESYETLTFHSSFLRKGVDRMEYTLLGFGITLAILLTLDTLYKGVKV